MIKRFVIFFALFLIASQSHGQFLDTISASLRSRPTFFFDFTSFNSFINDNQPADITGFRIGLQFNHRIRTTIGQSWLVSILVDSINVKDSAESYTTSGQLKFTYTSFSLEYVFYNKYPWEFSVPVQIGGGAAHYEYVPRTERGRVSTKDFPVVLLEPTVAGQYHILTWLGVVGGLGYRFNINSTGDLKKKFDSPLYTLHLCIFIKPIYDAIFPNGPFHKKSDAESKPSD